jgi:hypothetical protein
MIGEDLTDHMPGVGRERGVRVAVVRELDERYRQRPAAASFPGGVIDPQDGAEDAPRIGGKEVPRDDQVARRIANAQAAEVDDGAEPAATGAEPATDAEQVAW